MKTRKIFFELPLVEEFDDHHDILSREDDLRDLTGDDRIMSKELDSDGRYYRGLFYYKGEMPSKEEIEILINKL